MFGLVATALLAAGVAPPQLPARSRSFVENAQLQAPNSPAETGLATAQAITWVRSSTGMASSDFSAIAASPDFADDHTLVAGSSTFSGGGEGGAVYKSTDGGATWSLASNGLPGSGVSVIRFSPGFQSDSTIFVASAFWLSKTTNGGATWVTVFGPSSTPIRDVAVSPGFASDHTVMITDGSGVRLSSDGGQTWKDAFVPQGVGTLTGPPTGWAGFLRMSPSFGIDGTAFEVGYKPEYSANGIGNGNGHLLRTTDAGKTWVEVGDLFSLGWATFANVVDVEISPTYLTDRSLFAVAYRSVSSEILGIARSTDGGITWHTLSAPSFASSGRDGVRIAFSTSYAADRTIYLAAGTSGVYRSRDGGSSWGPVVNGLDTSKSCNAAVALTESDSSPSFIVECGDVLYRASVDAAWQPLPEGPVAPNVQHLAVSPAFATDRTIFAATSCKGLFKSTDSGITWRHVGAQISQPCALTVEVSPAFARDRTVFAGFSYGGLWRSTDAGETWSASYLPQALSPTSLVRSIAISPSYEFDRRVVIGTRGGILVSGDGGATWQAAGPPDFPVSNAWALAMSPAFSSNGTILAATDFLGPGLAKSLDFGQTWTSAQRPFAFADVQWQSWPGAEAIFTASCTSQTVSDICRSSDGGQTWSCALVGSSLTNTIFMSPNYGQDTTVFVGTDSDGIFKSSDGGVGWTNISQGLDVSRVFALKGADGILFAGTAAGAWRLSPGTTVQTISFGALADRTMGDAPFAVDALSSSGLPVTFSSQTPGVCSVTDTTVTLLSAGTCTIAADQVGNATYAAAPRVTRSFAVAPNSASCTYAVTPTALPVAPRQTIQSLLIGTQAGCAWTMSSGVAFVTISGATSGAGNGIVTVTIAPNPRRVVRTGTLTLTSPATSIAVTVTQAAMRPVFDFDDDGLADVVTFTPGTGKWTFPGHTDVSLGGAGDVPVPARYDADRGVEHVVFRPSTGEWISETGTTTQWGLPGDIPVPADYDGDGVTDRAVFRTNDGPGTVRALYGNWYIQGQPRTAFGLRSDIPVPADFDGDGKADLAVFRPSIGTWFWRPSSAPSTTGSFQWGAPGDVPVPGDFDGDGKADCAVFRPATGTWYLALSGGGQRTIAFGVIGEIPLALDVDGDGKDDLVTYNPVVATWSALNVVTNALSSGAVGAVGDQLAVARPQRPMMHPADRDGDSRSEITVYRPSRGEWFTLASRVGPAGPLQWGLPGDVPVTGDYDGDRRADPAVYRPSEGNWYLRLSSTDLTSFRTIQWGLPGDVPIPADYDGDGRTDLAIFRPSTGEWWIRLSSSGYTTYVSYRWGISGDEPVPADYDGDGRSDIAVFRPSTGEWYVAQSATGTLLYRQWGLSGDIAEPRDFDGDGRADFAVYRPSVGMWFVLDRVLDTYTMTQWGLPGDVPVANDYDGDGKADLAVYRPSTGEWYIIESATSAILYRQWGLPGDVAIR